MKNTIFPSLNVRLPSLSASAATQHNHNTVTTHRTHNGSLQPRIPNSQVPLYTCALRHLTYHINISFPKKKIRSTVIAPFFSFVWRFVSAYFRNKWVHSKIIWFQAHLICKRVCTNWGFLMKNAGWWEDIQQEIKHNNEEHTIVRLRVQNNIRLTHSMLSCQN